jgi:hypothetical protein
MEFVLENQRTGIHYPRIKTTLKSGRDHVWRTIDADHLCAERNKFFGQCSVATTQIEDALTKLWLEQIDHRLPERGHEMSICGIGSRVPMLGEL